MSTHLSANHLPSPDLATTRNPVIFPAPCSPAFFVLLACPRVSVCARIYFELAFCHCFNTAPKSWVIGFWTSHFSSSSECSLEGLSGGTVFDWFSREFFRCEVVRLAFCGFVLSIASHPLCNA